MCEVFKSVTTFFSLSNPITTFLVENLMISRPELKNQALEDGQRHRRSLWWSPLFGRILAESLNLPFKREIFELFPVLPHFQVRLRARACCARSQFPVYGKFLGGLPGGRTAWRSKERSEASSSTDRPF